MYKQKIKQKQIMKAACTKFSIYSKHTLSNFNFSATPIRK